ncbi:MAG: P-loop NTPase fold protein [Bacteroidales bacterium]|jgi:hypothetical protein|nr:P-loop NTPase fold protein [Bacteroidales bacterium]
MWADNETDQDLLGFSIHANLLQSIVTNPEILPITVGVFGDWGGGKSSILKILKSEINKNDDFAVIYFNSWIFEGYEDAKSAILTTLLTELKNHRNLKDKIGDEVKSLLGRVDAMKILKFGASAGLSYLTANPLPFIAGSGLIGNTSPEDQNTTTAEAKNKPSFKMGDLFKSTQDSVQTIQSFRSDFQNLIKKTDLKALIILIDDLDRCSPDRLIENLEAVKLFLNVERTAFVVATDRRIVENAIRIRYSELFNSENSTAGDSLITDYLEKLIQVPYTLPKLAPHEVRSYLCLLFLKKYLSNEQFEEVLKHHASFLEKERYVAFEFDKELSSLISDKTTRDLIAESMRLVEACSDAITDGLKGNPRQIKRFLNAFWLRRELAQVAGLKHLKDHILIKLMVLEYISSDHFEELYRWHSSSSDGIALPLTELEAEESVDTISEEYAKWKTIRFWRWIKAEPELKNEDLRDYFWISRSSIADTFSGVRLVTQAMKSCAEEMASNIEIERKQGLKLFYSLSEDEQEGVLSIVSRTAMQNYTEDAPLRSLIDLSNKGNLNAAKSFSKCIERIRTANLGAGLGITLRSFNVEHGNRAAEIIGDIKDKLAKTETKIGRAIKKRKRGKP